MSRCFAWNFVAETFSVVFLGEEMKGLHGPGKPPQHGDVQVTIS